MDLETLSRPELVDRAKALGLPSGGTKQQLAARILAVSAAPGVTVVDGQDATGDDQRDVQDATADACNADGQEPDEPYEYDDDEDEDDEDLASARAVRIEFPIPLSALTTHEHVACINEVKRRLAEAGMSTRGVFRVPGLDPAVYEASLARGGTR